MQLSVRVTAEDSRVVLTVKDFRMGVAGEVRDRFWKAGNVGAV
jgi:C4-dicarboxylate-specific signal transduction histidine kinase